MRRANAHKSWPRLAVKHSKARQRAFAEVRRILALADRAEAAGMHGEAIKLAGRAKRLYAAAQKSGRLEGPVGVLPNPRKRLRSVTSARVPGFSLWDVAGVIFSNEAGKIKFGTKTWAELKREGKATRREDLENRWGAKANPEARPFFCSICDSELKADAKQLPSGRWACGKCQKDLKAAASEKSQVRLFEDQPGLFNPARACNVPGYKDSYGQFHPIRKGKGYVSFLTTDVASPEEKAERKQKRDSLKMAEYVGKSHAQAAEQFKRKHKSLSQFVRGQGGIAYKERQRGSKGSDLRSKRGGATELGMLSPRETGTTGLLNKTNRRGTHDAERMMDAANVEGYRDRSGQEFSNIGDFISAVADDASGVRKFYTLEDLTEQGEAMSNPRKRGQRQASFYQIGSEIRLKHAGHGYYHVQVRNDDGRWYNAGPVRPMTYQDAVSWARHHYPQMFVSEYADNPPLTEWDTDEDEAFALGDKAARMLGHSRREARKGLKLYKGGYYSKLKDRHVEFIMPIEAHSAAEAKAQVKAMVTNEKPVNVTAREVKRNPMQQDVGPFRGGAGGFRLKDDVIDKRTGRPAYIFSWLIGKKGDPHWVRIVFTDGTGISTADRSIKDLTLVKSNPKGEQHIDAGHVTIVNPKMSAELRQAKRDLSKYVTQAERAYARYMKAAGESETKANTRKLMRIQRTYDIAKENSEKAAREVRRLKEREGFYQNPTLSNPLKPSLTALQDEAVSRLLAIRPKGRRGSGGRQAMQRKAIRVRYGNAAMKLGYTAKQIAEQWQDVLDMADLERFTIENPTVSEKISQLRHEGVPQSQAVAIAFSEKRAGKVNPAEMQGGWAIVNMIDYLKPSGKYPYAQMARDMEAALEAGHKVGLRSVPGFLTVTGHPDPQGYNLGYVWRSHDRYYQSAQNAIDAKRGITETQLERKWKRTRKVANPQASQKAYKGYLILYNPMRDEFYVKKDGYHIGTANSEAEAKRIIDGLTVNTFEQFYHATRKRNASPYELNVDRLEKIIREVIREDKRHGTVGSSAVNLRMIVGSRAVRAGVDLPNVYSFNQAFAQALDRVRKGLKGYQILSDNPGLIDLAATMQAADYLKKTVSGRKRNPTAGRFTKVSDSRLLQVANRLYKTGRYGNLQTALQREKLADELATAFGWTVDVSFKRAQGIVKIVARGKRKHNPSVTALSKTFQGKASGKVDEYKASNAAPSNLARIGKLVLFVVNGKTIRIPGAMVAADSHEKLWIVNAQFTKRARSGQRLDYGPITRIIYETVKAHIEPGKRIEYDHAFEQPLPHLQIDAEGCPIIAGGGYKIKREGITG